MIIRLKFVPPDPKVIDQRDARAAILVVADDPEGNYFKCGTLQSMDTWLKAEGFSYVAGTNGIWANAA